LTKKVFQNAKIGWKWKRFTWWESHAL